MMSQSLFQRLFPNYSQDTFKYWWCQVYIHLGISIISPTHVWHALLPIMHIPYCTLSEQISWSDDVENSKVHISFDNFRKSSLNFSDLFESWSIAWNCQFGIDFPICKQVIYKKNKTECVGKWLENQVVQALKVFSCQFLWEFELFWPSSNFTFLKVNKKILCVS